MFHIFYLQAKQDQLEADGLFNPAFFGNQARGFLITTSDFITKFMAFVACLWVRVQIPRIGFGFSWVSGSGFGICNRI